MKTPTRTTWTPLAALAAAALAACSGEAEYEVVGSLEGAAFAAGPQVAGPAGEAVPETSGPAPVAAPEPGGDAAPTSVADLVMAANPNPPEPEPATEPSAGAPGAGAPAGNAPNPDHAAKAAPPKNLPDGTRYLAFEDVAWPEYEPLDMRAVDAEPYAVEDFPPALRELDGQRIAFDGYMVPVDFQERKVTSFILSRYLPGCCFGTMPRMDEWIEVEVLQEGGVEYFPYRLVRVIGELEVGEELDDYGYVKSIYRIAAETVDEQL